MLSKYFTPLHGPIWWGYIIGAFALSLLLVLLLQLVPQRFRKYLIQAVTFIGGLLFALEFFLPTHKMPTAADPDQVGNFLSPYVVPFGNITTVIFAWTIGLGVINLCQVHGKRLLRGSTGSFYSAVFFISMIAMTIINILQKAHPNSINKNLNELLFTGGYQALDSTMFSIIAFYIVSAAYRAFRVRSFEASLLLTTALIVMLGQIALGQMLTSWIPKNPDMWVHNFRLEVIRDWILTKANAPAMRAISFGLGIGSLAVALRIWLGLERGSYFD